MFAEQFAVVPPFEPLQLQVHGPLPLTLLSVPAAQRLLVGFIVKVCPLDVPHAPFTEFAVKLAVTIQLPVMALVV